MSSSSRDPFSLIFAEDLTCEEDLLEVIVRKFEKQSYGSIGRYFVAKDEQAPFEFRFAQIPNFYSGMMMSGILGGFWSTKFQIWNAGYANSHAHHRKTITSNADLLSLSVLIL